MTELRAIISQDMEATPDQMVAMQDGIEASIDHIVGDMLIPGQGYAGMAASFTGTVVTIGAGRIINNGGKVYSFNTALTVDMLPKLPAATKKAVLFIGYGTEEDTNIEQVNVLIEAQSTPQAPVYKPSALPTTHERLAVVQPAYGDEAPTPVTPDPGLAIPIALVILGPTGIISCANIAGNKVPNLANHETRIEALETFEAVIGPEVSTLASQLAALANGQNSASLQQSLVRAFLSIADLDAKVGIPTNNADSSADYLLDGSNSDLANPLSNCKVMEGIRFADDGAADAVLNLFNPFDTNGMVKNGVLLPSYDRYLRRSTGAATASLQANSYTYNPIAYTQVTMARTRVRYGSEFTVCTNSAFWQSGSYDPISGIFTLPDGETFKAAFDLSGGVGSVNTASGSHVAVRLEEFWTDTVSQTYWDAVVQAPQTIAGYHLAESELIGQDQWIDAIGFYLQKLDTQGDVTVLVCNAGANAAPDPTAVLAKVTIPFASLVAGENVASLPTPVLLSAGQRVSYVIVTTGAHAVSTTDGVNFPQGTFFVLAPSGFAQGDLTKHLCLNLYGAKFRQSVASVQLQNLQLAGGMTSIDILAGTIVPASTTLTYEIQLAGVWVALSGVTTAQLNAGGALPPNVPLRVTMAGTPDMMPALNLASSNAHVSRPKTALTHIWPLAPRTPPVATSQVGVIARYESWNAALHSVGVQLLTGAGYTTVVSPSSFTDKLGIDAFAGPYLERTYVFNLGSAITSYKVKTTGTTTTALQTFHGASIKDYVL